MDKDRYLVAFETFEKKTGTLPPSWVSPLRKAAMVRFAELGFPTLKDEEWKYASVEPIAKNSFRFPFEISGDGLTAEKIKPFLFLERGNRLVFVNGQFRKERSSLSSSFSGVRIGSLQQALTSHSDELEPSLAKQADFQSNAFTALNTAFLSDGVYLSIPKGKVLEEPIELLFFSSSHGERIIAQPRNLILLGEGAQATVIENDVSLEGDDAFTNAVTEIFLAPAARLTHYQIQRQSEKALHVSTTQVSLDRDSHFSSHVFSFGAQLSRNNLNVTLDAEGSRSELNGLYMVGNRQHVDHHTTIDHAKPHGTSQQVYKGVLSGHSRAVFSGKIFVRKNAQKTDAHQVNKNLLLSEGATVDTKPQLEIFADDVKCTHGAAVGQLSEEEIFYVKSRGMGEEAARNLLTYGFASEILNTVKLEPVRSKLDQLIWDRLKK